MFAAWGSTWNVFATSRLYRRRFGYGDDKNGVASFVTRAARHGNSALVHQIDRVIHGIEEKPCVFYGNFAFCRRRGVGSDNLPCRSVGTGDGFLRRRNFSRTWGLCERNYTRKPFKLCNKCGAEDFFTRKEHKFVFAFGNNGNRDGKTYSVTQKLSRDGTKLPVGIISGLSEGVRKNIGELHKADVICFGRDKSERRLLTFA